jgi:hypothetical protein
MVAKKKPQAVALQLEPTETDEALARRLELKDQCTAMKVSLRELSTMLSAAQVAARHGSPTAMTETLGSLLWRGDGIRKELDALLELVREVLGPL